MASFNIPRIMITAPNSSSGKTTAVCGILKALINKELKVVSCKCGPDYIDPMFHEKVLNTPSKNLDTYFTNYNITKQLFFDLAKGKDIAVIEGVMGYYDGLAGSSIKASSYDLAKCLKLPVILVINAKGMSLTLAAIIKGIMEYKSDSNIKGVILNQASPMLLKMLKPVIEKECNIKVLGCIPYIKDISIDSRHLGLVKPDEIDDIKEKIKIIADAIEENVDLKLLTEIAQNAPNIELEPEMQIIKKLDKSFKMAIAKDEAFCFYYKDNFNALKKMGVDLIEFSPLHDEGIPKGCDAVMLGGGYPENYARQLSENKAMLKDLKNKHENGLFIFAECGGFMYLHENMEDIEGKSFKMAGIIKADTYKTDRLKRFGYIELTPLETKKADKKIKGHEFHYWDSTDCGNDYMAVKPISGRSWECIHLSYDKKICAGFPHLYYYSNWEFIYDILKKITEDK